jgi:hypothetical protein
MLRLIRLAVVALSVVSGAARAAEFKALTSPDGSQAISMTGQIELNDDEKFARVASNLEDATVWLNSPGGSTIAGLSIGTAIRLKGWRTAVPQGASCASSCGLIWLAGAKRILGLGARVGFHASYVIRDGVPMEAGAGNALVGSYLNKLGMRDTAIIYTTSASPTSITWLTAQDAKAVGISATFDSLEMLPGSAPSQKEAAIVEPPATAAPMVTPRGDEKGDPSAPTPPGDSQVLGQLYRGFPGSIVIAGEKPCLSQKCSVSIKKRESWLGSDGQRRFVLIAAVEIQGACHACRAELGVIVLRWENGAWIIEERDPLASDIGSFGTLGGEVEIMHIYGFDPLIEISDTDMHFGEVDQLTSILGRVKGHIKSIIDITTMHATGGSCDPSEDACRSKAVAQDYTSTISSIVAADDAINLYQTFSGGTPISPRSWHVDRNGTVTETSAPHGPETQFISSRFDGPFNNGRTDRAEYERWFYTLIGDARSGADFWAGQRSLKNPVACSTVKPDNPLWTSGCLAAQQKLTPLDAKRKADPEYRRGWNSL